MESQWKTGDALLWVQKSKQTGKPKVILLQYTTVPTWKMLPGPTHRGRASYWGQVTRTLHRPLTEDSRDSSVFNRLSTADIGCKNDVRQKHKLKDNSLT